MVPRHLTKLLATAWLLREAARNGAIRPFLKGRNFALMCDDDRSESAMLFHQATTEMGAVCVHLQATPILTTQEQFKQTASLLSRLYDAVECQGLASHFVADLARYASIPIYDGLAKGKPPIAQLGALMGSWEDAPEHRKFAVQAILVHALDDQ